MNSSDTAYKVVALGGGHGLAMTLSALRRLPTDITAIVTVADNGGSSGRLRQEMDVLPPGDLRMALAALCGDDRWGRLWADVLQHRFRTNGELHNHALGNLLIIALWELLGDHVDGLDMVGKLLEARGRVLPMSAVPLDIEADVTFNGAVEMVRGQAEIATTTGRVERVRLEPTSPPAHPAAVAAIRAADWVILGPGSWFTSVIPHLLVPEIRDALVDTAARKILVMNLGDEPGETAGFTADDLLQSLIEHAPQMHFDIVLCDQRLDRTPINDAVLALGGHSAAYDIGSRHDARRHDPLLLAAAFRQVFDRT